MKRAYDAVVAGAGIVGCAIAFELARRGATVLLLDKGDVGGAVTGGSLACIGTHMVSRDEIPLLIAARDRWRDWSQSLGRDFEYRVGGQLRFVDDPRDIEIARGWVDLERSFGLPTELLDPASVRARLPLLEGPIAAATWSPGDATVNPFLACRALVEAARAHGADVAPGTPLVGIDREHGRVTGAQLRAGHVACGHLVVAAGPWSARLAALAGCALPLAPRKAQCLATVAQPPILPCVVGACESAGGVEAGYTQIQQAASGQILFNTVLAGGLRGEGRQDDDLAVDLPFVHDSVAMLLALMPRLAGVALLRSWCAYEAVTPDDRFLAGPVRAVPGLWIAAGDGGTGFNRAPIVGELIAQGIVGEAAAFPTGPYRPDRFDACREAA